MRKSLNLLIFGVFVASTLLGMSCSRQVNIFGEPNSSYHKTFKKEMRKAKAMTMEKTKYETYAVRRTPELRRQYVDHFAEVYRLTEAEKETLWQKELEASEQYEEFLVFHYATNPGSSKIRKNSKNWKIQLRTANNEKIEPVDISNLNGDKVTLKYFYPTLTPWTKNYIVKFDKTQAGSSNYELLLDNVDGHIHFSW